MITVIDRMEKVKLRSARGQAKVLGTLICIGGSLIFTLWKGAILYRGFRKRPLIHIYNEKYVLLGHAKDEWIKGSALIMISYIAWSAWLILQVDNTQVNNNFNVIHGFMISGHQMCERKELLFSTI